MLVMLFVTAVSWASSVDLIYVYVVSLQQSGSHHYSVLLNNRPLSDSPFQAASLLQNVGDFSGASNVNNLYLKQLDGTMQQAQCKMDQSHLTACKNLSFPTGGNAVCLYITASQASLNCGYALKQA